MAGTNMAGTIADYVALQLFTEYDLGLLMCKCFQGREYPLGFHGQSDPGRETSAPCKHSAGLGPHVVQESEACMGKKLGILTSLQKGAEKYVEGTYSLMVLTEGEDVHTANPAIRVDIKADGTVLEHRGIEGLTEQDRWEAWVDEVMQNVAF
jgi:hypothetical protein